MPTKKTKATKAVKSTPVWSHKKHGKGFTGSYAKGKNGKRNFFLTKKGKNGSPKVIEYTSPRKALATGWELA